MRIQTTDVLLYIVSAIFTMTAAAGWFLCVKGYRREPRLFIRCLGLACLSAVGSVMEVFPVSAFIEAAIGILFAWLFPLYLNNYSESETRKRIFKKVMISIAVALGCAIIITGGMIINEESGSKRCRELRELNYKEEKVQQASKNSEIKGKEETQVGNNVSDERGIRIADEFVDTTDPYDVSEYSDPEEFADEWEEEFDEWEDAYDYWEDGY